MLGIFPVSILVSSRASGQTTWGGIPNEWHPSRTLRRVAEYTKMVVLPNILLLSTDSIRFDFLRIDPRLIIFDTISYTKRMENDGQTNDTHAMGTNGKADRRLFPGDLKELNLELKRRVWWNDWWITSRAISL